MFVFVLVFVFVFVFMFGFVRRIGRICRRVATSLGSAATGNADDATASTVASTAAASTDDNGNNIVGKIPSTDNDDDGKQKSIRQKTVCIDVNVDYKHNIWAFDGTPTPGTQVQ